MAYNLQVSFIQWYHASFTTLLELSRTLINSGVEKSHLWYVQNVLKSSDSYFLEFLSTFSVFVHQHAMNIYFLTDINITNITLI